MLVAILVTICPHRHLIHLPNNVDTNTAIATMDQELPDPVVRPTALIDVLVAILATFCQPRHLIIINVESNLAIVATD